MKLITVVLTIMILAGCREVQQSPVDISATIFTSVQLLKEDRVLVENTDSRKIDRFKMLLAEAHLDSTNVDFKSFDFIRFIDSTGTAYRIEIFGNKFRFKGKRYVLGVDILTEFNNILH